MLSEEDKAELSLLRNELEPQSQPGFSAEDQAELDILHSEFNENEPLGEDRSSQAKLEGFGQGATAGYLPHLQAKLEPVTDRIFGAFDEDGEKAPWSQMYSNDENYLQSRDSNIKRNKQLERNYPADYMGGQIAGTITTGIATSGLGAGNVALKANLATKMTKGALAIKRAREAAAFGAAYGAVMNPEDIEGVISEMQIPDRMKNSVIGAMSGYGIQRGLSFVAGKSSKLGREIYKNLKIKAKNMAEMQSAKAMGLERGTRNKLTEKEVLEVGRFGLDEDILSPSLVGNTKKMAQKIKDSKSKAGKMIEKTYSSIDDKAASEFNPLDVASQVDDELGKVWRTPINKGEVKQFDNMIETLLTRGDKNIPLGEAQKLKELISTTANWKNKMNVTAKEKMARDAYDIVNKAIDKASKDGADKIGVKGLAEGLTKGKKLYSTAIKAQKLIKNRIAREDGNKFLSLTDSIVGTGAFSAMGPIGIGAVVVKKMFNKYGNQVSAKFLNRIAKSAIKTPSALRLSETNPAAFQAVVLRFGVKLEESFGKRAIGSLKAAEQELKGRDKWISDGLEKTIKGSKLVDMKDPKIVKRLLFDKKGERLLIEASGKNSKNAIEKIEKHLGVQTKKLEQVKGHTKWAHDGAKKLFKLVNEKDIEKLKKSKKGLDLLVRASDMKTDSKPMRNLIEKINKQLKDKTI